MRSVYVHVPFCKTICSYCDFCKFYYNEKWVEQYLDQLEKEIKKDYLNDSIKTIYIGGGTPSSLSISELNKLFEIIKIFDLKDCIEFTFECNIENITREKAMLLKDNGVNRLSIGVQSFNNKNLEFLNRHHTKKEVKEKIEMLKEIGFLNINVDLIYALPNQTIEELEDDLELFLELDIPHISTYSLMIEPHTKLGIKQVEPIEEEKDALMYEKLNDCLKKHGYIHYETSNFSKKGFFSNHNLVYWNNEEYYGFGIGASGYINHIRYDNTRNWNNYINGRYRQEENLLTRNEEIENEFILGFRKMNGILIEQFYHKYHKNILEIPLVKKLLEEGKLVEEEGKIRIVDKYIYTSNQILYQFIGENYE